MVIRSFLSVGQGAFYCEQFKTSIDGERVNIVYDCGSDNVERVEEKIRNNFEKGEDIQAVFISHLDEDHINGLPYLLKYCRVKKIFFPLISRKNIKYIKLSNLIKNGEMEKFSIDFLENPYMAIERLNLEYRPIFYQIGTDRGEYNDIDIETIPSGEDISRLIMRNVEYIPYMYREWIFIPYNFCQEDRIWDLQRYLSEMFGRNMNNEDIHKIWEFGTDDERKKIKQAYKKVKGSFNTNSMTLYSGIINFKYKQRMADERYCRCYLRDMCGLKNVGCLYTGDYDASGKNKWRELYKAYSAYWDTIGCVQLPHHGSRHNYNKEFGKINAYYIISAGTDNRYQHPHSMVIKDLLYKRHFPYIVTEHPSSEIYLIIG